MAKRSTSSTKKPAKKTAPAKKAASKKKAAPAKKAAAAKKAAPAKKTAARKVKVAAPVKKPAAPPRKAKPAAPVAKPKKKSPARRAAAAVKSAAKTAAAVMMAPVKAVAAVVAGPVVENPPDSGERREEDSHDGRERSTNGASAHPGDDDEEGAGEPAASSDPDTLIERIESAYNVSLPERYRRFLLDGEYQRYPRIELNGYIRGPYQMDFLDDLLPDVAELGQNAGIYDMDDVPWNDDYQGFVPLASLSHPEVDEPKVFLVHQVAGDQHRVLLFDYEGWKLYPLADSFDNFLANLPRATNDISTSLRPGDAA